MEVKAHFDAIVAYYRARSAWSALAVATLIMIYGGGAAMFWFHSILLGEGGPAISPLLHWFVDSTAGLLALTPVLFLLLPIASRYAEAGANRGRRFALLGGALFAVATAPGPVLHDTFVGRGTWLAGQVTLAWGDGRELPPSNDIPVALNMVMQVAYGLPVYIALMWLTYLLVRPGGPAVAGPPVAESSLRGSDSAGAGGPGPA